MVLDGSWSMAIKVEVVRSSGNLCWQICLWNWEDVENKKGIQEQKGGAGIEQAWRPRGKVSLACMRLV